MNKKIKKKLRLDKLTIQTFPNQLEGNEQKKVNGGFESELSRTTVTPVFCKP